MNLSNLTHTTIAALLNDTAAECVVEGRLSRMANDRYMLRDGYSQIQCVGIDALLGEEFQVSKGWYFIYGHIQSNLYISLASGPEDPMLLERLCVYRGFV